MRLLSRRTALKGLTALIGVGAAAPVLVSTTAVAAEPVTEPITEPATAKRTQAFKSRTLVLVVTGLRPSTSRPDRAIGQQLVITGTVREAPDGGGIGDFYAVTTAVHPTGGVVAHRSADSLESQTFHLAAGTLIGQGTSSHGGSGSFAVIGGTGVFHTARGSYTQERDLHRFGGGIATYSFTLTAAEDASNGI